jgi:hypothetical protein
MPKIVRARSHSSDWLPAVLMGAAVGAAALWLLRREPSAAPAGLRPGDPGFTDDGDSPRPLARRERKRGPSVDASALTARLHERPGTADLRVQSLGQGIVELVGSAGADLDLGALIKALADEPGVTVVVNRVWTPASAARA